MNVHLILKTLEKASKPTNILLNMFIGGFNYKEFKRKALYPTLPDFSEKEIKRNESNFYSLLSYLKKQGFVKKGQKRNKTYWIITSLGKEKLEKLKSAFPKLTYKQEKDDGLNIFTFDIPEKQKAKRNWLRRSLLALNFKMLQKSVWIGKNKLPEEFLKDLNDLKLIDFIHIFRVNRTGTIKELNL